MEFLQNVLKIMKNIKNMKHNNLTQKKEWIFCKYFKDEENHQKT